ncbi:MAG TPA: hypothetical protein VJK02_03735 [Anaerolineales bacterium]|nr:hypothetical protein [Anaerolineales bacterium]
MRDVLIFTPVLRLEPETVRALMMLEWEGSLSLLLQRDNPTGDRVRDHLHQYQRGREAFLRGSYEAMLIVESDIVPPPDTLTQLAALECDVAYGCTVFRNKAWSHVVNILERYPGQARNTGESLTIRGLWQEALRQGVIECSGSGLACVLIQRHVLEAIDFRVEDGTYCDNWWTRDVYEAGYSMKASTNVICGHIDTDGSVIWPERATA